jgi:hypothetical protein
METKTVKYINVNGKLMDLSHPQVMGILNVTPDSFYAGSRQQTEKDIINRTSQIIEEGASIIDIGAYSSRPNAEHISPEEEMRRLRTGLPEVSGLSQETMREKIIHERRMELAFEGHRWFDMIRVNNGEYAIKFLHSIGKSNVNKNRLLFPIPQTEMDANTLMVQNPGY